jgi:hypothetical protein
VESTREARDDSAATGGERSVESTREARDDRAATGGERSVESTREQGGAEPSGAAFGRTNRPLSAGRLHTASLLRR